MTLEIFFSCISYVLSNLRMTVIIDKFSRIGESGGDIVYYTILTSSQRD